MIISPLLTHLGDTTVTVQHPFILLMGLILVPLVLYILFAIFVLGKVFKKAGVEGWKAIIPVYNSWVLMEISGKPGWWSLIGYVGIIPLIGIPFSIAAFVLYVLMSLSLAKKFGKGTAFAIFGLIIFSIIGYMMLAFGDSRYDNSGGPNDMNPPQPGGPMPPQVPGQPLGPQPPVSGPIPPMPPQPPMQTPGIVPPSSVVTPAPPQVGVVNPTNNPGFPGQTPPAGPTVG